MDNQKHIQLNPKIVAFGLYFFALFLIVGKLFFETQFDAGTYTLKKFLLGTEENIETLRIGLPDQATTLNPFANDSAVRARLLNVYEGLTRIDRDLKLEPGLAISYGALDDVTWEFRLRPEIYFHDGGRVTVDDVIFSLDSARKSSSGVKDLLGTVDVIQKGGSDTLYIKTSEPDPLLPSKLAFIFIVSQNANAGTGPYEIKKNENGILELQRFEKYWGERPAYKNVVLKTIYKKDGKIAALKNNDVDILANLPADLGSDFSFKDFKLQKQPSLEVNFLMFNFNGIFASQKLRQAVKSALDTGELMRLAQGFAVPATQFVANGIFGYDPEIKEKEIIANEKLTGIKLKLDLPRGLESFGKALEKQLEAVGLDSDTKFLNPSALAKKIESGNSADIYFFGWSTELGDAFDFLTSVAHSREGEFGAFNGSNYSNPKTDELIESAQKTMKSSERLNYLRSAMKRITEEDIIGIPLFSPEILYAVSKDVEWKPRVDGYVLAQDVKM